MNFRVMLCTAVFSLHVGASSQASIQTTPTGLNPGDQYRLAFVTKSTRDATSSDIAVYNSFVQTAANAVTELASLGATWKAIASTKISNKVFIDARDNTGTNPLVDGAGVPIYLLNSTLLASNNADLWDGSILAPLSVNEFGETVSTNVWTGTQFSSGVGGVQRMGDPDLVIIGNTDFTTSRWILITKKVPSTLLPLYAMSSVLTVEAVPEPTTFLVWSLLTVSAVGIRRRYNR